ncbi:Permease of the drug/metabolite transporter (DMT) superfamily [Flaviramulus basaltis]|uniref:Permease of the drug/metabolite transporter (DMT) superfamily n=1 Tax=Flaviramulus basaltis TaxID=369401 RepID=A0A1K2IH47_9FLAO|nr:EamA family transporter [Flaviramulus basaltis]SFZ91560.1 Permease of the drug/metabolite transporter (DMT) superfamily [Flaviramulus basaltis]
MGVPRKTITIVLAFFAIYVIWGSTYLLNKIAVSELSPFFLASVRFLSAGAIIFSIAKFMKMNLSITRKQLINAIISSFLFLVYGNGVFVWALKYVDSGFGALIAATQPLFVLLLMKLIDGKKMQTNAIIGVVLGIVGMYVLVSQKTFVTQEGTLLGIFMILTCVLSWSYGSIFVSNANLPANYFVSTAYQMISAGLMLIILSFSLNESWVSPISWSTPVKWSMLLLIVFGSVVAFTAFNYLLKVVSTEKVSTSAYVNPVVAIFMGWYILDEIISVQTFIAAIILLTGVYFITTKRKIRIRPFGR